MRNRHHSNKENYIKSVFAQEDLALGKVISSLREDEAHMQISPVEGKILYMLVQMVGARKIIEIGTLAGYSSIWMARALPQDGRLYAIEIDYKKEARIRDNFSKCKVESKIELTIGKAIEILPKVEHLAPFDVVFIDADKVNYLNYLDWAEKNIRKGGLIIGDNSLLFGTVYGDNSRDINPQTVKIMQEFNLRLANPDKYSSIILPTSDGMTVAIKNF
jgi:hypothetical protein